MSDEISQHEIDLEVAGYRKYLEEKRQRIAPSIRKMKEAHYEQMAVNVLGPDTMVIYENDRDIGVRAEHTNYYNDFIEVRTNIPEGKLIDLAESLHEIAQNIEKHWAEFTKQREERVARIARVAIELQAMHIEDRSAVLEQVSQVSGDIPF